MGKLAPVQELLLSRREMQLQVMVPGSGNRNYGILMACHGDFLWDLVVTQLNGEFLE